MSELRGDAAADFMFGSKWRELNAETAKRDKARAELHKVPCGQPDCANFCCVTVEINGAATAVCRECADKVLFP